MFKQKVKLICRLFLTYLKIGTFTFGGGYAMIPLIQKEIVEKKKWLTDEDILDIIAIAESTPGPFAINSATFVGFKVAGFFGSVFATLGVVLPSFIIIAVISRVLDAYSEVTAVRYAFNGIRAGVLALIVKALYSMYKKCPKGAFSYCVMALSFIAAAFLKTDIIFLVIGCGAAGFLHSLYCRGKGGEK